MSMLKGTRTKILLAISLLALGAGVLLNSGLIRVGTAVSLYVVLPVGAVFFGLFLISRLLQDESEFHDSEARHARDAADRGQSPYAAPPQGPPGSPTA